MPKMMMKMIMKIETGASMRRQNFAALGSHFWNARPMARGMSMQTSVWRMFLKGTSVLTLEKRLWPRVNSQRGIMPVEGNRV